MQLSDTFQAPIVETVDGQEIEFPRLLMEDWARWASSIKAARRKAGERRVDEQFPLTDRTTDPVQRTRALRQLDNEQVTIAETMDAASTPEGIVRAVEESLVKAGKSPDEAKAIRNKIDPIRQANLALEIASLQAPTRRRARESDPAADSPTGQAAGPLDSGT